ncbi:MAG: outer membrane beta-barrel protein [Gammaproteobacteria bacterium]|nr:outer membrane beta-barrel protein [Gammaproteobacteria bacterium]
MKKKFLLTSILALLISQAAFSNGRPFYVGAQLGGCDLHYDRSELSQDAIAVDDRGFAGRLLAGFNINQNLALEMGYTKYSNPEFSYLGNVKSNFSQESLDFLGKFSLPISCNLSVYATAGMAFVQRDDAEVVSRNVTIKINEADDHLRPMLGLGVSYGFNSRVSGEIGYFRTFGTDDLEDADFYGAGFTFRIG